VLKHCRWNEWMRLTVITLIFSVALGMPMLGTAQDSSNQTKGQSLPNAPAPNNPLPGGQVAPGSPPPAPANTPDLVDIPLETPTHGTTQVPGNTPPPPMPPVKTVPPGSVPPPSSTSQEELYKYVVNTNFVVVPVTVKDPAGHPVEGLLQKDFSIYEDGKPQTIRFFTSDPFALSAAVILDLSLQQNVVSKVNQTLPALVGAFSQYDEVALYTYGSSVQRVLDFVGGASDRFAQVMKQVRAEAQGRPGGVPVVAGPMAAGPSVNGHPMDPSVPPEEARTSGSFSPWSASSQSHHHHQRWPGVRQHCELPRCAEGAADISDPCLRSWRRRWRAPRLSPVGQGQTPRPAILRRHSRPICRCNRWTGVSRIFRGRNRRCLPATHV
jgi:hypothetical protein